MTKQINSAGRSVSWKTEIRRLCRDFCINPLIASGAINAAKCQPVPEFYKGNADAYHYDYAYRLVKSQIMAALR